MAADYVTGISEQWGERSLERIEASGYWMDLVARRRAVMNADSSHIEEIRSLIDIVSSAVSSETASVYQQYVADYLS